MASVFARVSIGLTTKSALTTLILEGIWNIDSAIRHHGHCLRTCIARVCLADPDGANQGNLSRTTASSKAPAPPDINSPTCPQSSLKPCNDTLQAAESSACSFLDICGLLHHRLMESQGTFFETEGIASAITAH
jgi:hypothetical protein